MVIPLRWLQAWDATDILNYRVLSAAFSLWLFLLIFRRRSLRNDISTFKALSPRAQKRTAALTIAASLFLVGNWYTYIYAVNSISIQSAAFAYMICPLINTLAAFLLLNEKLSGLQWLALGFALCSVLLLAQGSLQNALWSVLIASLYAFYLITQRISQGFNKLNLLAFQLLFCCLLLLPMIVYGQHAVPREPVFWFIILLIAILFTIVPLFLSMYALTRISSSATGILLYANPIIAFLLGVLFFKEEVFAYQYFAYSLLLVAILLFNSKTLYQLKKKF